MLQQLLAPTPLSVLYGHAIGPTHSSTIILSFTLKLVGATYVTKVFQSFLIARESNTFLMFEFLYFLLKAVSSYPLPNFLSEHIYFLLICKSSAYFKHSISDTQIEIEIE